MKKDEKEKGTRGSCYLRCGRHLRYSDYWWNARNADVGNAEATIGLSATVDGRGIMIPCVRKTPKR